MIDCLNIENNAQFIFLMILFLNGFIFIITIIIIIIAQLDEDHNKQSVFVEQEEMDIGPHVLENIVPSVVMLPPANLIPVPVSVAVAESVRMQQQQQQNPVVSVTPATPPVVRPNQLTITSPVRPAPALAPTTDNTSVHAFGDVSANRLSASPG